MGNTVASEAPFQEEDLKSQYSEFTGAVVDNKAATQVG